MENNQYIFLIFNFIIEICSFFNSAPPPAAKFDGQLFRKLKRNLIDTYCTNNNALIYIDH